MATRRQPEEDDRSCGAWEQ